VIAYRDQVYAAPEETELRFDFVRPDVPGDLPLIVFLHGGGWISGDKEMYRDEAIAFADRGFACACPEYRLAPLNHFPDQIEDVQSFVQYARTHAAGLGVDPNRVYAFGNSAGGYLAAALGLWITPVQPNDGPSPQANRVVAVCPITDLTDPTDSNLPIAMSFLEQYMGCRYDTDPDRWREASPIAHLSPLASPLLIAHGTEDDVVPFSQSVRFAAALDAADVPHETLWLPREGHSFTFAAWETIAARAVEFFGMP